VKGRKDGELNISEWGTLEGAFVGDDTLERKNAFVFLN
jgi:hypothetical protein